MTINVKSETQERLLTDTILPRYYVTGNTKHQDSSKRQNVIMHLCRYATVACRQIIR